MSYLGTHDLEDHRQELEDEFETMKSAITEAEDALDELETLEADSEDRYAAAINLAQAHRDLDKWEADNQDEFDALNNLRDEFDRRSWRDGITRILERDFKNYAMDLAEDIHGSIEGWPFDCIDWEKAANALRTDYSSVEYEGVTYLYRE